MSHPSLAIIYGQISTLFYFRHFKFFDGQRCQSQFGECKSTKRKPSFAEERTTRTVWRTGRNWSHRRIKVISRSTRQSARSNHNGGLRATTLYIVEDAGLLVQSLSRMARSTYTGTRTRNGCLEFWTSCRYTGGYRISTEFCNPSTPGTQKLLYSLSAV